MAARKKMTESDRLVLALAKIEEAEDSLGAARALLRILIGEKCGMFPASAKVA